MWESFSTSKEKIKMVLDPHFNKELSDSVDIDFYNNILKRNTNLYFVSFQFVYSSYFTILIEGALHLNNIFFVQNRIILIKSISKLKFKISKNIMVFNDTSTIYHSIKYYWILCHEFSKGRWQRVPKKIIFIIELIFQNLFFLFFERYQIISFVFDVKFLLFIILDDGKIIFCLFFGWYCSQKIRIKMAPCSSFVLIGIYDS